MLECELHVLCSILFYSILFYSTVLYAKQCPNSTPMFSVLSVLAHTSAILFCSVLFYSVLFCSVLFCSVLFSTAVSVCMLSLN